ncbi:MAG TPA: glycosyltransferase family 2 protein, partial [Gammaproteobacteria bacterium]
DSTLACVRSLIDAADMCDDCDLEIVVGDNGSDDSERDRLHRGLADDPRVQLIDYKVNLGFAAGHNRNLEAVLARTRPDFTWLLNNDCVVESQCIDALLNCASRNPEVGIWGATLLELDDRNIQCAGGCTYNSWLTTYRSHGRGIPSSKRHRLKRVQFDYVSGASMFFPIGTIETGLIPARKLSNIETDRAFELLNESFFLYFEELDLAERLKPGLSLGWCRDALILHTSGHTTGAAGSRRSAQAEYHSTLSALKFTRLYYPRRLWLMAPARFLAKSAQLLFTGNFRLLGSMVSAYQDFWKWLGEAGV